MKYISSSKKKNCRNGIFIGEPSVSQDFSYRENKGTLMTEKITEITEERIKRAKD